MKKNHIEIIRKGWSLVRLSFRCMVFICSCVNAMDESTPLDSRTRVAIAPSISVHQKCCGCGPRLPDWYDACFGPVITNIKFFGMDPFWVDKMSPLFQELYENALEGGVSSISRCIRKPCIFTRTIYAREERYNPILHWGSIGGGGIGLSVGCIGLFVPICGTITNYIAFGGFAVCLAGCAHESATALCSKINYRRPDEACS